MIATKEKIIVICGPTATGKTGLAVRLAKEFGGEIISADSRQIYRGMDIGTGKDVGNAKFQMGHYLVDQVKIWLYDVVEPNQEFTVADYYDLAWKVINDIWKRGKLPLLVGGAGFYIKAVVDGLETLGIPPNPNLRSELSKRSTSELGKYLKELNPARWEKMNDSDRKNPRRLTRAIELAVYPKRLVPLSPQAGRINPLFIGLTSPYKDLYLRIDDRVEARMEKGLVDEVKKLLKKGYNWNLPSMSAMGYREFEGFFKDKASLKEAAQKWKLDEHGYARRQMTWLRSDKRIHWFDISTSSWQNKVRDLVAEWLL